MKAYRRLCLVEREAIGVLYHCGSGVRAIAGQLYRSPSTISREINGLIRQCFPKGTDFNQVSAYEVRKAQDRLNGRPRNVLNWKTPFEAFNELLQ